MSDFFPQEQIEHRKTGVLTGFEIVEIADEIEKFIKDKSLSACLIYAYGLSFGPKIKNCLSKPSNSQSLSTFLTRRFSVVEKFIKDKSLRETIKNNISNFDDSNKILEHNNSYFLTVT